MSRVILHCDCNSFFASVETALNPAYKNVPMAVCGSESDRHGIVLAKNELAKKYNIQTAETVYSAKRKCPTLVIAEPHYEEYKKYSRAVNRIYARYTDMIEPFGIDESWLDVTASKRIFGSGLEIAERIRKEVREELGITVSIGVSFNKVFAKLGSDYKKPDAVTVIDEENYKNIVFPLPVSDLLFVGKKTSEALISMGIKTIGALSSASEALLCARFGKMGEMLHRYSNGLDDSPVCPESEDSKSISNGLTFRRDLTALEDCRVAIDYLTEQLANKMKKQGQMCRTVSITIKDNLLKTVQRQRPTESPTDTSRDVASLAFSILKDEWHCDYPIRMITVTVSNLVRRDSVTEQMSFFDETKVEQREKDKKRDNAIDNIRQKFGVEAIVNGAVLVSDIGIREEKKK